MKQIKQINIKISTKSKSYIIETLNKLTLMFAQVHSTEANGLVYKNASDIGNALVIVDEDTTRLKNDDDFRLCDSCTNFISNPDNEISCLYELKNEVSEQYIIDRMMSRELACQGYEEQLIKTDGVTP